MSNCQPTTPERADMAENSAGMSSIQNQEPLSIHGPKARVFHQDCERAM